MNKIGPNVLIHGKRVGFCYLLDCRGHQKIGRSSNVDGVIANARRFDASVNLVSCWPSIQFVEQEAIIHKGLQKWRIENEQFRLPPEVVQWMANLDDREFAAWVYETECDERTIGWEFPRVFANGKNRAWACLMFPESDVISWGIFIGETKPDYSFLEKAWLQDSRGFRSSWIKPLNLPGRNSYKI